MRSQLLYLTTILVFGLVAGAPPVARHAQTSLRLGPSNAECERQTYKLNITSENVVYQNVDSMANQTYLTSVLEDFITSSDNFTKVYVSPDTQQVSNTYSISGTLCTPKSGAKNSSHIQYLVHGVGFDSRYWDFYSNETEQYSYVRAAAEAGYTTFRYDRLGTGLSEKPRDAYNVVQASTELAIAARFAEMLRNGDIGGQKFSKIVGVGHSYGSDQVQALSANVPDALDAVILTGFSTNGTAFPILLAGAAFSIATNVAPNRLSALDYSNAYLSFGLPQTNQLVFFHYPNFDDAIFQQDIATAAPVTQGVIFSWATISKTAQNFTGPVQVITGDKDYIFCYSNCYAVPGGSQKSSIIDYAQALYPAANNFTTYLPSDTGHAINLHYSAPDVYQRMLGFVDAALS